MPVIEEMKIGIASDSWDNLTKILIQKKYSGMASGIPMPPGMKFPF